MEAKMNTTAKNHKMIQLENYDEDHKSSGKPEEMVRTSAFLFPAGIPDGSLPLSTRAWYGKFRRIM